MFGLKRDCLALGAASKEDSDGNVNDGDDIHEECKGHMEGMPVTHPPLEVVGKHCAAFC